MPANEVPQMLEHAPRKPCPSAAVRPWSRSTGPARGQPVTYGGGLLEGADPLPAAARVSDTGQQEAGWVRSAGPSRRPDGNGQKRSGHQPRNRDGGLLAPLLGS
jgi:hypothetical protein